MRGCKWYTQPVETLEPAFPNSDGHETSATATARAPREKYREVVNGRFASVRDLSVRTNEGVLLHHAIAFCVFFPPVAWWTSVRTAPMLKASNMSSFRQA